MVEHISQGHSLPSRNKTLAIKQRSIFSRSVQRHFLLPSIIQFLFHCNIVIYIYIYIYISSNKHHPSNKRATYNCGAYYNSYHISLRAKPRWIWNQYANNKTPTILLIFRFLILLIFHYIWFSDSEDLCFACQRKHLFLHTSFTIYKCLLFCLEKY